MMGNQLNSSLLQSASLTMVPALLWAVASSSEQLRGAVRAGAGR